MENNTEPNFDLKALNPIDLSTADAQFLRFNFDVQCTFRKISGRTIADIKSDYGDLRTTPEWASKAITKLFGKEFETLIDQIDSEDDSPQSSGYTLGAFISLARKVEKGRVDTDPVANFLPFKELILLLANPTERLLEYSEKDADDFLKGLSKGLNAILADDGNIKTETTATPIYAMLVARVDIIDEMETVEEIHDYLKKEFPKEFHHQIESFKVLCNRIHLKGRNYRSKNPVN